MTNQKDQILTGLTKVEVQSRKDKGQVNVFKDVESRSTLKIFQENLFNLSNMIIFTAIFFLVIYQQYQDAVLFSGVIILNSIISIIQELKSKSSLEGINIINREKVLVVRDSEQIEIMPEELVKDEIIVLKSGSYIFVDGVVVQGENLMVDESIITGESDYKQKAIADQMYSGAFIVAGRGFYQATKVGEDSFLNKISQQARKYVSYLSPLQISINKLATFLTIVTIIIISILLSLNFTIFQLEKVQLLNAIVSVVTSTIPQGILMIVTLAFIIGVIKMYRKKILVQQASSIETLSAIRVLCMDKTGTLTENKLQLTEKILPFSPVVGNIVESLKLEPEELIYLYTSLTLERNKTILALEQAMLNKYQGTTPEIAGVEVIEQLPFTSKTKYSGMKLSISGQSVSILIGAVESLQTMVSEGEKTEIQARDLEFSDRGLRNLVCLIRKSDQPLSDFSGYQTLGIFSLEDKLRHGAADIIKSFLAQNIKPVVISGDGPNTLRALMKQLHIEELNNIISGEELAKLSNKMEFTEAVLGHDVFARTTPEQKLEIIKCYQSVYSRVAMIGDGVNDALAIKQANLGISLSNGANVTKNIADVVLLDNDLSKLADVMIEGKQILFNTLSCAQLSVVKNVYALIIVIGALSLLLPFPFSPRALFLLSFLNGNLPVIIILADTRPYLQKVSFMRDLVHFSLVAGGIAGIIGLLMLITLRPEFKYPEIQTILVTFLVLVGGANSLIILNRSTSNIKQILFGSWRSVTVLAPIILMWVVLQIPVGRTFFAVAEVSNNGWYIALVSGVVYFILLVLGLNLLPKVPLYHRFLNRFNAD